MKKDRRWLKSVLAASAETSVKMPWERGQRRRPAALASAAKAAAALPAPRAIAAH